MLFLEIVVVAYHVLLISAIVAVAVDYAIATEKLLWLRKLFDDDILTPLLGLEILCFLAAVLALATGYSILWIVIQAVTVLILMAMIVFLFLWLIGSGIERLRNKNLK